MKNQQNTPEVSESKAASITFLYIVSAMITLAGLTFSIVSLVDSISLRVLTSEIPGAVFGIVVVFLGVRYMLSVNRLKKEVYKPTSRFSWSNFRKLKK